MCLTALLGEGKRERRVRSTLGEANRSSVYLVDCPVIPDTLRLLEKKLDI